MILLPLEQLINFGYEVVGRWSVYA